MHNFFHNMCITFFLYPLILKYFEKYWDKENTIQLSFRERKIDDCAEMILFVHDHSASDELKKELGIKAFTFYEIA